MDPKTARTLLAKERRRLARMLEDGLLHLRHELAEVDAALDRLDGGVYGLCEACGSPIREERLRALPATRVCVAHAPVPRSPTGS